MPITGLSDRVRMPRLGKIHLGIKKETKGGKEYPAAVDYFVCDSPEFKEIYGEEPRELRVMIPVEDVELWASQYYRRYSSFRGLTCKGDGRQCHRLIDTATGEIAHRDTKDVEWRDMVCRGTECLDYTSKPQQCREIMNLQFMLPD